MATHMQVPEEAPTLAVPKDLEPDVKPPTRTVKSMMGAYREGYSEWDHTHITNSLDSKHVTTYVTFCICDF